LSGGAGQLLLELSNERTAAAAANADAERKGLGQRM